jgi:hypothetical protein
MPLSAIDCMEQEFAMVGSFSVLEDTTMERNVPACISHAQHCATVRAFAKEEFLPRLRYIAGNEFLRMTKPCRYDSLSASGFRSKL